MQNSGPNIKFKIRNIVERNDKGETIEKSIGVDGDAV